MSVIIKGMGLPTSCSKCRLRTGTAGAYCRAANDWVDDGDGNVSRNGRHNICNLIELPKEHGRLIDADCLIKKLGDMIEVIGINQKSLGLMALTDIIDLIESESVLLEKEEPEKQ